MRVGAVGVGEDRAHVLNFPAELPAGDQDVRASYVDLEGVGASVKGTWELAGVKVPYPAHWSLSAGERVNCRCSFYTDVTEEDQPEPVLSGEAPLF